MKFPNKLIILIEILLVQDLRVELLNIVIEVIVHLKKITLEMIETPKMARLRKMGHFKRLKQAKENLQAKAHLNILNKLRKKVKNYMMHLLKS
jgi:hypothetical protein